MCGLIYNDEPVEVGTEIVIDSPDPDLMIVESNCKELSLTDAHIGNSNEDDDAAAIANVFTNLSHDCILELLKFDIFYVFCM